MKESKTHIIGSKEPMKGCRIYIKANTLHFKSGNFRKKLFGFDFKSFRLKTKRGNMNLNIKKDEIKHYNIKNK